MTGDHQSLAAAVVELERHTARAGWDQPARLFALVDTAALVAREPQLAETIGDGGLTSVEQEGVSGPLEDLLTTISWPDTVQGCAAVVERYVLPPTAEEALPDEAPAAVDYASGHPQRQEVRIVAAALRDGPSYCALRLRTHDDDAAVLTGESLVPGLVELVRATLQLEGHADEEASS